MIRENKSVQLGVRVPPSALEEIDRVASECGLSRAAWIRQRIATGLRGHGADNQMLLNHRKKERVSSSRLVFRDASIYLERGGRHLPKLLGMIGLDGSWLHLSNETRHTGAYVARRYRRECAKDGIDIEKLPERLYKFLALYPEKL